MSALIEMCERIRGMVYRGQANNSLNYPVEGRAVYFPERLDQLIERHGLSGTSIIAENLSDGNRFSISQIGLLEKLVPIEEKDLTPKEAERLRQVRGEKKT